MMRGVTELQSLSCAVTWFRSHTCQILHLPHKLHASAETCKLINEHEALVVKIKVSVAADYQRQKTDILYKRKKRGT